MLANLPANAAQKWPHPAMYSALRGWALEKLMEHLFVDDTWADLQKWRPRRLAKYLLELAEAGYCDDVTRTFLREHPFTALWLAGCLRQLFKCLRHDWDVRWVRRAPSLPVFQLPNHPWVDMGEPDLLFFSEKLGGFVFIEIKNGSLPNNAKPLKIAKYTAGGLVWLRDNKPAGKLVGVVWMSFSSSRRLQPPPSPYPVVGKYALHHSPTLFSEFVPVDEARVAAELEKRYDYPLMDNLFELPRLIPKRDMWRQRAAV